MTEVNRHISYYDRYNDKYIGKIPLNNVGLNDLLPLVPPDKYKNDPLLYNCYLLDKTILDILSNLDNQTFVLDMDNYEYYLEATAK